MNLQTGAFGDPAQIQTLVLFWTKMELLHYPGAGETRAYLEEELHKQQLQQQMAMQMQMAQQQMQQAQMQRQQNGGLDMQTAQAVIQRAQQDAARDSGQTMGANAPVGHRYVPIIRVSPDLLKREAARDWGTSAADRDTKEHQGKKGGRRDGR